MAAPTARSAGAPKNVVDGELIGSVKPANRPGRRRRHADDQERHDEERSRVGERNMKCLRRQPDPGRDRQPQRQRQRERDQRVGRAAASPPAPARRSRRSRATMRASRAGRTRSTPQRQPGRAARDGRPARRARRAPASATPRPRAAADLDARKLRRIAGHHAGADRAARTTANSSSTVTRSSRRSRMMVANAAVGVEPLTPRQQVRPDALRRPAPAAGTLAAKPITVVRNAVLKRVGPIGASRYCQRNARSA